jgi:heme-degrading monooxygenase HmoA
MHALASTIEGSSDQVDAAISNFRENVVLFTREAGGKGSLLIADRQTGKVIAITLWESEDALRSSEKKANELRGGRPLRQEGLLRAPTVERYEVAVFET